jgi:hypothetical protein
MGVIQTCIGLDVGEADHVAMMIEAAGAIVFDRGLRNDE